jgi:membrane protein YqaA with SNARE-associated domain
METLPDTPLAALAALFVSSFTSATLLPGTSELVLGWFLINWRDFAVAAIAVATIGNTAGGMLTYAMGRLVPERKTDARAVAWLRKHGAPLLVLSWVPVAGDALCAAAGWLRLPVVPATLWLLAGKLARYLVIAGALLWWRTG